MKNTYKFYYQLLEELRIESNLSVGKLTDGVMAERTYYRYLNSTQPITYSGFSKLLEKLDVQLGQIILYGIHFRGEDAGLLKFVFRAAANIHSDIYKHYNNVKAHLGDSLNTPMEIAIQAYLRRFEMQEGIITRTQFIESIDAYLSKIADENIRDIYILTIYILEFQVKGDQAKFDLKAITNYMGELEFTFSPLFYMVALTTLLDSSIEHKIDDRSSFLKLMDVLESAIKYFFSKMFLMKNNLYLAYLSFQNKEEEKTLEHLFTHGIDIITMMHDDGLIKQINVIEDRFNIDFDDFMATNAIKRLKTKI